MFLIIGDVVTKGNQCCCFFSSTGVAVTGYMTLVTLADRQVIREEMHSISFQRTENQANDIVLTSNRMVWRSPIQVGLHW